MKKETKKLLIFLGVTFGINLLIGIPRGILVQGGYGLTYGGSLPCCPAAGLVLAKVICDKDQRSTMPMYFFTGILVLTAASFLLSLADLFLRSPQIPIIGGYLTAIGFGLLVILFFLDKKETRNLHGLGGENWALTAKLLTLYAVICFARVILPELILGDPVLLLQQFSLTTFLSGFVLAPIYLNEEYGWRCYFQPLLQKKFGLIKGVLVFGFLWELWHHPILLPTFSPEEVGYTIVQFILSRYVAVMGIAIFMAYAYMKTQNVWTAVLIHSFHNAFSSSFIVNETVAEPSAWWITFVVFILVSLVLFVPFLFSNVFRKPIISEETSPQVP